MDISPSLSALNNSLQSMTMTENRTPGDSRITQIRDQALTTIRHHLPITTLFRPELKIDLGVFINDQILMQRITDFLAPFANINPIDEALISDHFKNSELFIEIKAMFKQDPTPYLLLMEKAFLDVLQGKVTSHDLQPAIEGRIFTLKNALVAQHNPKIILQSQIQQKLTPQDLATIQAEGALFLRETLRIHLQIRQETGRVSFKEELLSCAEQLIPFVQKITRIYLREHGKVCPDNPLIFRNPSGYNHHGLVAATVMEACLNALGYSTRLMGRSDLEPKVTLATAHNVVEVESPTGSRYLIDPSYLQFHQDLCLDDSLLPTSPLLLLTESEVDRYIEDNLMVHWTANKKLVEQGNSAAIAKLDQRDQLLPFKIHTYSYPVDIIPSDTRGWVKNAFQRVWDLRGYRPILFDQGFQEIFLGAATARKTYDTIQAMGIAPLTSHLSISAVEKQLNDLLLNQNIKGQNCFTALKLISQLPKLKRASYDSLLDVDPQIREMNPILNGYFRSLKKTVNPEGTDKSVIYGCAGADCTSVLLATDGHDFTFVDLTVASYPKFNEALERLRNLNPQSELVLRDHLEKSLNFVSTRSRMGGTSSRYCNGTHVMEDLPLKIFFDLRESGVDLNQVVLTANEAGGEIQLEFPWRYHGATASRRRTITIVTADLTKPATYPLFLKRKIESGFDIFYMKAAFSVPHHYPEFLPHLAKSINQGGWLMTADKTFTMESINPETCLSQNNLIFLSQKKEEVNLLEELMHLPFDPLVEIPSLRLNPGPSHRSNRTPGSDLSYWSMVTLRQKK